MTPRVLGIDPGTAVTGYGVVEPFDGRPGRLVECGVIRTPARQALDARLEMLYDGVRDLLRRHRPAVVSVETVFYGRNVHTTVALGHARAVVLLAARQAGVEVVEYAPATVKKSVVGRGGAAKAQVGYMVQQLLRLRRPPTPADAADGVALALTHLLTQPPRTGATRGSA